MTAYVTSGGKFVSMEEKGTERTKPKNQGAGLGQAVQEGNQRDSGYNSRQEEQCRGGTRLAVERYIPPQGSLSYGAGRQWCAGQGGIDEVCEGERQCLRPVLRNLDVFHPSKEKPYQRNKLVFGGCWIDDRAIVNCIQRIYCILLLMNAAHYGHCVPPGAEQVDEFGGQYSAICSGQPSKKKKRINNVADQER